MAKWWQYVLNPIGTIGADIVRNIQRKVESNGPKTEYGEGIEQSNLQYNPDTSIEASGFGDFIKDIYNDVTGKSQIELQNKLQRELAEEEYQRNLQSISDTAAAYDAAGFNKNLLYSGASPASYTAPSLQAYSGSARLDTILNRSAKVLGLIPALYQATASLEGIDQARERTKQAEIKTMADGMNLINLGYKLGDTYLNTPFTFKLNSYRNSRHVNAISPGYFGTPAVPFDGRSDVFQRYADASLKNKFDLLESIGLGNSLRRTRNAYMGYQYDLDRRYGAAGRIVGMASQSLGAAAKLMPGMKYFFK